MPVRDIGRHGYKSDIKALCWMYFLMGTIFGCGIGEVVNLCGAQPASHWPSRAAWLFVDDCPCCFCVCCVCCWLLPQRLLCLLPLLLRVTADCRPPSDSAGACEVINFGAWYSCHARERLRR